MAAAMIKQAPRTSGQPVLRRWNSTSPATVSTNAKRVSETRGIKDTPLTRTFGTWLNGEMFNTDWLTCNVSPISSTNTNAPSAPPAHERQPRNETVQRHRGPCHHPDGGQVRERGDQHKLQGILALCKASGSQDAVELYLSPVWTVSLNNVADDGKEEEEEG
ncbi:MAG: hypothetical protein ACXV2B_06100 [Halobacteriota archaeon]